MAGAGAGAAATSPARRRRRGFPCSVCATVARRGGAPPAASSWRGAGRVDKLPPAYWKLAGVTLFNLATTVSLFAALRLSRPAVWSAEGLFGGYTMKTGVVDVVCIAVMRCVHILTIAGLGAKVRGGGQLPRRVQLTPPPILTTATASLLHTTTTATTTTMVVVGLWAPVCCLCAA